MIEAFFFGEGGQRLFGAYHPPAGGGSGALTVICPPLFSEYMRTQLLLRQLAINLAAQGQHVLRFDYRGTGDSSGELAEVTVADWLDDIALAVREGRELCAATRLQLAGVRAGALLVCKAAGALRDIERVVLWDPVADGVEYLRVLRRVQAGILERNDFLSRADRRAASDEYGGYRISARMANEFRLLGARSSYSGVPRDKLQVVSTSPECDFPLAGAAHHRPPFVCDWETDLEAQIVPRPVLETLTACLTLH